ncbi:RutC protein [Streptomyces phaeolivaceus]|uniref:RutC protein n=1 Tax=Streptomyces phaeolivaceus TaxID=2653200 RepID=A0A5P8KGH5_9ACTN|nr:Rid family detoxifying hydrolase [Streptomyces phaeolivaceus]QFR01640.1 RutC protein [Streptomyces phaeolivaceus]
MPRRPLVSDRLPAPLAPYSTAVLGSAEMWLSGQLGLVPGTAELAGPTATDQLTQIFANLDDILAEAGKDHGDVLRVTLYLADMGDFDAVNGVYAEYFAAPYPARTAIAVAALPMDARIEADVVVG